MMWLLIALGGAVGAVCRFWLTRIISWRLNSSISATLLANILGSFALGFLLLGAAELGIGSAEWRIFLELGFLGGFTTFATFAVELRGLLMQQPVKAFFYAVVMVVSNVLALVLGATISAMWFAQGSGVIAGG